MIKIENECVSCGWHCLGSSCPNRNVPNIYCDDCGDLVDEVYVTDGEHLCEDCLLRSFEKINNDNVREWI